jgi:chemotaxis protein MotB
LNRLYILICVVILSVCYGCVSKAQYEAIQNENELLVIELGESEIASGQSNREKVELMHKIKDKQNEVMILSRRIEELEKFIMEKDATISIQSTFIRLFDDSKKTLQNSIKEQLAIQNIELPSTTTPKKLVLLNNVIFESGSANLNSEGKDLLRKLTKFVQEEYFSQICVNGHTDNKPMKPNAMYATNWELSAARATAVVRFLQESAGVDPERISAIGFGQYRPIASNETNDGRRQNRRIEIVIEIGTGRNLPMDN